MGPADMLTARAASCPPCGGVYRLYSGRRLLHVGMAAGEATVRSEVMAHALGRYGPATRRADRIEWHAAPDPVSAYRLFLSLYTAARYRASKDEA